MKTIMAIMLFACGTMTALSGCDHMTEPPTVQITWQGQPFDSSLPFGCAPRRVEKLMCVAGNGTSINLATR